MVLFDTPFEAFFDLVPTGAVLYTPVFEAGGELVDFRFVRLNPAGQRLLNLPAQPPGTFREYFPHSGPTGIFAHYRTAYLTGQASTYDVPYQGDGIDTFFRLVAQRNGELLAVNFTDMADLPRSAVEQALRDDRAREQAGRAADAEAQRQRLEQQRATLYQVFELTPAAICIQRGPAHRFDYANAAYLRFFPGRDLLGQPAAAAIPEIVASGVLALLDHVYQTGETYYGSELPLLIAQPEGPPRQMYFTFTYQALRENGEIVGISTFAYNVVEQVEARWRAQYLHQELTAANTELHATNAQLTRTNTDLDTFVYTASHDLKGPITNIEGIVAALRETLPPPVQQQEVVTHLLGLLETTVTRFLTTITQLTDVARLQRTFDEPAQELALAPVVADVLADLAPLRAGAEVQVAVPAGLCVSFAPANLRSIVYNLLSNALKYRDPSRPARVVLRAERQPAAVVLTVQDNGLGLTESQQQRLFQLFQRLHTHVEGTGVGLYMIKRLIENAGATIGFASTPGAGTTFTVIFPA